MKARVTRISGLRDEERHKEATALETHVKRMHSMAGRRAVADALAAESPILRMESFDPDLDLLNTPNGKLDLARGELLPHDRDDLMTKMVPVGFDPAATAPRFEEFVRGIIDDDEVVGFLQRFFGYALSGRTTEDCIVFLVGGGANGKTTLIEAIRAVMGDYAHAAASSLIATPPGQRRSENLAQAQVARLQGRRLVTIEELPIGAKLDESLVKSITGGGTVEAAFKYGNPFSFPTTHKLVVATNTAPQIVGSDHGIWRRVVVVRFEREFLGRREAMDRGLEFEDLKKPEAGVTGPFRADPDLQEALQAEQAGILRWLVDGYQEWCRVGLAIPAKIQAATTDYRREQDIVSTFLDENFNFGSEFFARNSVLNDALQSHIGAEPSGELKSELRSALRRRGCKSESRNSKRGWRGVGPKLESDRSGSDG